MRLRANADDFGEPSIIKRELLDLTINGINLADAFFERQIYQKLPKSDLPGVTHEILVRRLQYQFKSGNLSADRDYLMALPTDIFQVDLFETVIAIYQEQNILRLINPHLKHHWQSLDNHQIENLCVVYAKAKNNIDGEERINRYLSGIIQATCGILNQRSPGLIPPNTRYEFRRGYSITPRYAIPVTNSAFHFGNVEAWQNIIQSYQARYPSHQIQVFHKNKPIRRISTLFKWGKVSSGDKLYFSIAGNDIKDIAKLKKYLTIASSPQYTAFIKRDFNSTLNIF